MLASFCEEEGFTTGEQLREALGRELKGKPLTRLRGGYLKALLTDGSYEGFLQTILEYAGKGAGNHCCCGTGQDVLNSAEAPTENVSTLAGGGYDKMPVPTSADGGPYAGWSMEEAA